MNEAAITMLKFWHKITNMDSSTFLKQAIEIQVNNIDSMEWAATIKFLLRIVNLQQLLDNPEHISTPTFAKRCKQKLREQFVTFWENGRDGTLRNYAEFRHKLVMEPYLARLRPLELQELLRSSVVAIIN